MAFITEKKRVTCEVRNEFLNVIWKKIGFQCSYSEMNFSICAHAQSCQWYQNFVVWQALPESTIIK
jgi:hypothetical protein